MSDSRVIHLAMAFDEHYQEPFLSLVSSVFANNQGQKLKFHLIASGLRDEDRDLIVKFIVGKGADAIFYHIEEHTFNDLTLAGTWTHSAYHRLYFPEMVSSEVTRLLYIDSDAIVVGDLAELFDIDLENLPVAAVYDIYVKKQELIGVAEGNYFNSGVLLIDIKTWREQGISQKALSYVRKYPERILYVDQCGLNAVLKNNWKHLDYKFNVLYSYIPQGLSRCELEKFLLNKVILHFTLERPWHFLCKNRFRSLYLRYWRMSPVVDHNARRYKDFSFFKIPAWLKIRLLELYFDKPFLQRSWRVFKKVAR